MILVILSSSKRYPDKIPAAMNRYFSIDSGYTRRLKMGNL